MRELCLIWAKNFVVIPMSTVEACFKCKTRECTVPPPMPTTEGDWMTYMKTHVGRMLFRPHTDVGVKWATSTSKNKKVLIGQYDPETVSSTLVFGDFETMDLSTHRMRLDKLSRVYADSAGTLNNVPENVFSRTPIISEDRYELSKKRRNVDMRTSDVVAEKIQNLDLQQTYTLLMLLDRPDILSQMSANVSGHITLEMFTNK